MKNYTFISMKRIIRLTLLKKELQLITKSGEDPEFFVLPDIGVQTCRNRKKQKLLLKKNCTQKEALAE